jgi:hypothetical protein
VLDEKYKPLYEAFLPVGDVPAEPRCQNCRFWKRHEPEKGVPATAGECKSIEVWAKISPSPESFDQGFGCIHFEPTQMPSESPVSDEKE